MMRGLQANGDAIRSIRKSLAMTQEQLAARAQCDVKTARKAEQSKVVDLSTLTKLARALKVDHQDLILAADAGE